MTATMEANETEPMWKVLMVVMLLSLFAWLVLTVSIAIAVALTDKPYQRVPTEIGTACVVVRSQPQVCA